MSERFYYPVLCRLFGREHFLIVFQDDEDGVVLTPRRNVLCADDETSLRKLARELGISLEDESAHQCDLDPVERWARTRNRRRVDCIRMLEAWNLLGDVARSVPERAEAFRRADRALNKQYEKLLFGNHLPPLTPPGEHYMPRWSKAEAVAMAELIQCGLRLFWHAREFAR